MPRAKKTNSRQKNGSNAVHMMKRIGAAMRTVRTWRGSRFVALWLVSYAILLAYFFRAVMSSYIEIFPHELVFPVMMHALTATLVVLSLYWLRWLQSFLAKLVAVITLTLSMTGYQGNLEAVAGFIRALTPGLTASDPMPIVNLVYLVLLYVLAVLIGVGAAKLFNKSSRLSNRDVELGLLVLAAYLFAVPAFGMIKSLPTMIRESRVQAPALSKPANANTPGDKPDIYYIVLDRYTNATTLKEQFNYDNSSFVEFLANNNFTVNDTARSNYPYTTMSISSTMNANYTKDWVAPFKDQSIQSRTLYHNLIWQSSVVKALKADGYKYYTLGSWYGASYKAPLADRQYINDTVIKVFGRGKTLRGIEATRFMQSPYYQIAQLSNLVSWWPISATHQDEIEDVRQQLNDLNYIATKEQQGGRFIFAHILVPHDPFWFNADGSISTNPEVDSVGKPIKDKYVGQVEFINNEMKELIDAIQKQSGGKAVILVNADEGAYPQVLNDTFKKPANSAGSAEDGITTDNMTTWSDDWLNMKFGILQAVHIPKATDDDLKNLSSVNLFRIVLNRYAGYDLPYLPECHFGLVHGSKSEYVYADITKRFMENPSGQCSAHATSQPERK